MRFDISVGPSLTHNALLNRANRDAAYRQSQLEHDQALNQFIVPGEPLAMRQMHELQGIEAEKQLPKYWFDEMPRRNFSPSSSFVESVEIIPALRLARISMNGKKYSYPLSPDEAGDMVTSESIGRFYNDRVKL